MEKIVFSELIGALRGNSDFAGDRDFSITSVSIDTRSDIKGSCFFAICGPNFDGHNFIQDAFNKGATAVVVSKNKVNNLGILLKNKPVVIVDNTTAALGELAHYYRNKFSVNVVAITGSCGKTTTKEMLATILQKRAGVLKTQGNFNNQIGLPLTIFGLNSSYDFCVLELGTSYPGEIKILSNIAQPKVAIITNVGLAHLAGFGSKNSILKEKCSIFTSLGLDGLAVVNADDEQLLLEVKANKIKYLTFGIDNNNADITASDIVLSGENIKFKINALGKTGIVILNTFGKHNVYNALAACAGAVALSFTLDEIIAGLSGFKMPPLRSNISKIYSLNTTIIDDAYNANPTSMLASIDAVLSSFENKNIVLVLGDMLELGADSQSEHEKIGLYLRGKKFEKVLFVGELMRFAYEAYNLKNANCFKNVTVLSDALKALDIKNKTIFFKASRGMRLEKAIEFIKERK